MTARDALLVLSFSILAGFATFGALVAVNMVIPL
jgi:hypothetical protein